MRSVTDSSAKRSPASSYGVNERWPMSLRAPSSSLHIRGLPARYPGREPRCTSFRLLTGRWIILCRASRKTHTAPPGRYLLLPPHEPFIQPPSLFNEQGERSAGRCPCERGCRSRAHADGNIGGACREWRGLTRGLLGARRDRYQHRATCRDTARPQVQRRRSPPPNARPRLSAVIVVLLTPLVTALAEMPDSSGRQAAPPVVHDDHYRTDMRPRQPFRQKHHGRELVCSPDPQ